MTPKGPYRVLATDFDGTLAEEGRVAPATLDALQQLQAAGWKRVLVTGRELPELRQTFPGLGIFDRVVAENGALLHEPATGREQVLVSPPPPAFAQRLRELGVPRVSQGRVVVATWRPHETTVLRVIQEMGLELEVIFNKDAVMVLPSGVNKGTGLKPALAELEVPAAQAVGVGDAENDHSLLSGCGLGVAVANAVPSLQTRADWVTSGARGAGVRELVARALASGLPPPRRHAAD